MYRTVSIGVGFKTDALHQVEIGRSSIRELFAERDQFLAAVRLILNTLPYRFDVKYNFSDKSSVLLIEIQNDNDNVTQWLKDWYCSNDATDSELDKALQKAMQEISACINTICDVVVHYCDRYDGNLLLHVCD